MRVWLLVRRLRKRVVISTHTPVRVWPFCYPAIPCTTYFNSHTREGVTGSAVFVLKMFPFQLTHPWGCDVLKSLWYSISNISTHTPVRVWLKYIFSSKKALNFNSHTREGVTLNILLCHHLTNFNSHTREGVTFAEKYAAKSSSNFNSHTREGVTASECHLTMP